MLSGHANTTEGRLAGYSYVENAQYSMAFVSSGGKSSSDFDSLNVVVRGIQMINRFYD